MENFRDFNVGPDPFGRTWHALFKYLQTGISIRHSDSIDVCYILENGEERLQKIVVIQHADIRAYAQRTGRKISDTWCLAHRGAEAAPRHRNRAKISKRITCASPRRKSTSSTPAISEVGRRVGPKPTPPEVQMTRRDCFSLRPPRSPPGSFTAAAAEDAVLQDEVVRLQLKHTWTTVMSSSTFRDTLHVQYGRDGLVGYGEGAPISRYNETPQTAKYAVETVRGLLEDADPAQFAKIIAEVFKRIEGQYAAKAAIDIALMDWTGQKLGVPLYRYFGLDPEDAPDHHVFHRHRRPRNHQSQGRRGRPVPGAQDQSRSRFR